MDKKTRPAKPPRTKKLRFGKMVTDELFKAPMLDGEAAGRIMLVEASAFLSNNNCGTNYPVIPFDTRNAITSRVMTQTDVDKFSKYSDVINYLTNVLPGKYFQWQEKAKVSFFEITRFLELTYWAELMNIHRSVRLPVIMTEAEYNEKLNDEKQRLSQDIIAFSTLVLEILRTHTALYEQKQNTFLAKVFDLAKKTPLPSSGPDCEQFQTLRGLDPSASTMFDALRLAWYIYRENNGDGKIIDLFSDFPPVKDALEDYFKKDPLLKQLTGIAPEDYNKPAVKLQDMDELGLISLENTALSLISISNPSGIAILKEGSLHPKTKDEIITKEGSINQEWIANPIFEVFRIESLLDDKKREALKASVKNLVLSYKRMYVAHVVLELTANLTKVHEVKCTFPQVDISGIHEIKRRLNDLNKLSELQLRNAQDTTHLAPAIDHLKNTLYDIDPESLLPDPEKVEKMRAYLTLENYKFSVSKVINTLAGA